MFEQLTEKPLSEKKETYNAIERRSDDVFNTLIGETLECIEMLGLPSTQEQAVKNNLRKLIRDSQSYMCREVIWALGLQHESVVTGVVSGSIEMEPIKVQKA